MKKALIGAGAAVVVLIAAVFVWFNFVRSDAPDAFQPTAQTEQTGDAATGGDITGTWTVGTGSEAGYRVVEDLGSIQDFEAVGRTTDISGSITIDGTTVTGGSFEVQVASITSDDDRRDRAFSGQIMSSSEFPTATLALSAPVELGAVPGGGEAVATTANGELTLRGVTNPVVIDVTAQQLDGRIEIVGAVPVVFSEYGIANPSNPLVTVRDEGLVEVKLQLDRS